MAADAKGTPIQWRQTIIGWANFVVQSSIGRRMTSPKSQAVRLFFAGDMDATRTDGATSYLPASGSSAKVIVDSDLTDTQRDILQHRL